MGCVSGRAENRQEEETLQYFESKLAYGNTTAAAADLCFRKYSRDHYLNKQ